MFDVVVVGAGHAGVEAAAAAARRGSRVALITLSSANLGAMSCNPSIGGVGKGHIVREIDAFDGLMGRAADAAAIHYRLLNRSKGKAVQGPRVQADRRRFAAAIRRYIEAETGITLVVGEVRTLLIAGGRVAGVALVDGRELKARAIVIATGTFLGAKLFRGDWRGAGGRIDERAATVLAEQLRDFGLPLARLKTGTPPRLDGRTIDWSVLTEQPSDLEPWTMSPATERRALPQVACAVTRTMPATHDLVREGTPSSPLFSGAIAGAGPRYCPSIEDKIARFGDRDGHQVFLEPEGLDDHIVYPNGLSTSLAGDTQVAMIATMPGLATATITTLGYAVEYDHVDPRVLTHELQVASIPGLFLAGQINGTTGYEEAAGQGLVAGINAAADACDLPPLRLDRASSYLGVMIDDLVLQGVSEPYRMLTARAEYRLSLRADNAETRLGPIAREIGCVGADRAARQQRDDEARAALVDRLQASSVAAAAVGMMESDPKRSAWEWLRIDGLTLEGIAPELVEGCPAALVDEVSEDARYAPYVERQRAEVERLRRDEQLILPRAIDFASVPGLSAEMIDRLSRSRPETLAAAARIQGVTPAALSAILLHSRKLAA